MNHSTTNTNHTLHNTLYKDSKKMYTLNQRITCCNSSKLGYGSLNRTINNTLWKVGITSIVNILWKQVLSSHGQQINQMKKNNQPRLISYHWPRNMQMKIQGLSLGKSRKCGEIKQTNGILTFPFIIPFPTALQI